jgi:enoyl-[acyl-carrier protein] reductase I
MLTLAGKRILVTGVGNSQSIAWGCATQLKEAGADVLLAYQTPSMADAAQMLAREIAARFAGLLDIEDDDGVAAAFAEIARHCDGRLDGVVHSPSLALRDDLAGRLVDTPRARFAHAMDVACHSFIRVAKAAEPLLVDGASLVTMSYYGAEKVIPNYGLMSLCKAALEAGVRHLASEMGPRNIGVYAVSPGPLKRRTASGIAELDELMHHAKHHAPLHRLVTPEEVGALTAFLCSGNAAGLTGSVLHVDAGYRVAA